MPVGSIESPALELLAQLRAVTGAAHAELDRAVTGAGTLSPVRYAALLYAHLDVLSSLEAELEHYLPGFAAAQRVALLCADLHVLGLGAAPARGANRVTSLGAAWGAAYVIEGSALGGLVLARELKLERSVDARALRYMSLRGAATADHWRSFCRALNAWGAGANEHERATACASACAVFKAYEQALGARLPAADTWTPLPNDQPA